mgnify:CR=1 FL=1
MVEHIVLFKPREGVTEEQVNGFIERLKGLKDRIDGIVDLQAGKTFTDRSQGYTIGLTVRFTGRAALEAYGPHPEHQKVVAAAREIAADLIAVDFEI